MAISTRAAGILRHAGYAPAPHEGTPELPHIQVRPGRRYVVRLPYSDVCCFMGVAGALYEVELLDRPFGGVQLYNPDGTHCSFPILPGEAGFYQVDDRYHVLCTYGVAVTGPHNTAGGSGTPCVTCGWRTTHPGYGRIMCADCAADADSREAHSRLVGEFKAGAVAS